MKKALSLIIACVLVLGLFAGCTSQQQPAPTPDNTVSPTPEPTPEPTPTPLTPAEMAELYTNAINASRDAEMNEYFPVSKLGDADLEYALEVLGLKAEDMASFAFSMSLMNVQAYAIVAVQPAEGKTDAVVAGLESYIEMQKAAFDQYLPEPYEHACNAKLETLSDGTVLLVMGEGQDELFAAISAGILGE